MIEKLSKENFLIFCMRHYDNTQCQTLQEFEEDLSRVTYIQKLFYRYVTHSDLKERLILNHLIILFNVFGDYAIDILFFKIDKQYWSCLITFLVYMNRMPVSLPEYGILTYEYSIDPHISSILKDI